MTTEDAAFPDTEVRLRLQRELQLIADDASVLRPEWEPLLDSQCVVGTVLALEDLFPTFRIPPDRVVRKGGYTSIDDAIEDITRRIKRIVSEKNGQGEER